MAKHPKVIDYQELVFKTLKEKFITSLLGFFVFAVFITSSVYAVYKYAPMVITAKKTTPFSQKATPKPSPKFPTNYIVQEGDTVSSIAQRMYGNELYGQQIMKANNLYTPDALDIGKTIVLPAVTPLPTMPVQGEIGTGLMTGPVTATGTTYIVQPGETLSDIALRVYGDNNAWTKIAQANSIADPNNVKEGTTLKIPQQ